LGYVDAWYSELLPRLAPLQYSNGGPIIAIQVENEYGSYGNDHIYLKHIEDLMISQGVTSILFASNGPSDFALQGGTLPELLKTINFGPGADIPSVFSTLRRYQPTGPLFVTEYWAGWFDHWTENHHVVDPQTAGKTLDDILANNGSVSIYMYHGGTNFGFMNGANYGGNYQPTVTSYDYDAPLNESGDPTAKYVLFRSIISKYIDVPNRPIPKPSPKGAYGIVAMVEKLDLLSASTLSVLSDPLDRATPEPMEWIGQDYGFTLYRTSIPIGPLSGDSLSVRDIHDRGWVFINGNYAGTLTRDDTTSIKINANVNDTLDILVENMGRINFADHMGYPDLKGIFDVEIAGQLTYNWKIFPLPLNNTSLLSFQEFNQLSFPAFYRGTFFIQDDPLDTFVNMTNWTKGVIFINGFNLGRYWNVGPSKTLYLPAPLLQKGMNELIILELEGSPLPFVHLVPYADLGPEQKGHFVRV